MLIYPVTLQHESGSVTVRFPDHPSVYTYGDTPEEALLQAADALLTEFMICEGARRVFAMPSAADTGATVALPVMASLKIFLHNAMLEKGYRKADLARITGWGNAQVERALDPRYQSKVPLIEEALHLLGKRVVGECISVSDV